MRWLLLLAAGCYSPTPPAGAPCGDPPACPSGLVCENAICVEPGSGTDAPLPDDAPADTVAACENFASQFDVCGTAPGGALVLDGFHTYSTDTHELRDSDGLLIATTSIVVTGMAGPIEVLVVESFALTGTIRAIGDVPFGIASYGDLVISGTLDLSGNAGGGAGRRGIALCPESVGRNGVTDGDGSSGAGGGSYQGEGGTGGEGDENQTPVAPGQPGDVTTLPLGPLGGCRGGTGGGGVNIRGEPGQGGGAIYLVAQGQIVVSGTIDVAGGGGGHGHAPNGGGGGGGSGGMIVLEASLVRVTGTLTANGGGGGGGADDVLPNDGADGENGRRDTMRAAGGAGAGTSEGGDGGAGGAGALLDGLTATEVADNGGGGGGGGCGFIAIGAQTLNISDATITPPKSDWPSPP